MKALRSIALLSAGLCAGTALAQETTAPAKSYLLRYALAKGQTGRVVIAQEQTSDIDAGGQKLKSKNSSRITMAWEVLAVEDGKAQVQGEIERLQIAAEVPMMGEIQYDSADEDSDPPAMMPGIDQAVGMVVTYKVTARGVISDIATNREEVQGVDMQAMLMQMGVVFPEEPVAIGGEWTEELAFGMEMLSAEGSAKYKLLGVDGKTARVRVVMDLETEASEDAPMPVDLEIKESGGEITVNFGQPMTSDGSLTTKMAAEMQGMKMDIGMTQRITPAPTKQDADKEDADGDKKKGDDAGGKAPEAQ